MTAYDALSASQKAHAAVIVATVQANGLPQRAAVICLETALVESNLTIYANWNVPSSLALPHEAVGSDHYSVGIFQQQVPSWGTAQACMDPAMSTAKFLFGNGANPGLTTLPGYRFSYVGHAGATRWDQIPTGNAAQAVQVSAFPDRYQEREADAEAIVAALWNEEDPMPGPADWSAADWAAFDKHVGSSSFPLFRNLRLMVRNAIGSVLTKSPKGWFNAKTTSWVRTPAEAAAAKKKPTPR